MEQELTDERKVFLTMSIKDTDLDIDFKYKEGEEVLAVGLLATLFNGGAYMGVVNILDTSVENGEITRESYDIVLNSLNLILSEMVKPQESRETPLMLPSEVFGPKHLSTNNLSDDYED